MVTEQTQHKCIYCDAEISAESNHIEHIITNNIGGKLKSSELYPKNWTEV